MTFPAAYKMKTNRPLVSATLMTERSRSHQCNRSQHILSLDGGGIRGVLSATILAELEDRLIEQTGNTETRLIDYFDYVAGTSTGGILACLYLLPDSNKPDRPRYSAREVLRFYRDSGPAIFKRSFGRKFYSLMGLRREKFCGRQMEHIMRGFMGDCRLKNLIRPCVIPAYDIQEKSAYYFRQELAASDPAHDFPVWQAARATAAAPLYFGPKLVTAADGSQRALIDGGVFANNPSLVAYHTLQNLLPEDVRMNIFSLGTGDTSQSFEMEDLKSKGMLNSWKPLLNIISSASGQTVDQRLKELLNTSNNGNYFRLNPVLETLNTSMDDISDKQLDGLMALGEAFFDKDPNVISQLLSELTKR